MQSLVKRDGCSLKVSDQVNIYMPPEAFTDKATNFWIGVLFGGLAVAALIAASSNS
jgi:hypothetical protein